MWNRRDFAVLATAAVATFGLTLAMAYPRLVNAIDRAPKATLEVKTPTLALGTAQVSAARDEADPQVVNFTVTNTGDEPTKAEFLAQVMETSSIPSGSRTGPVPQPIWSQEMSSTLKGGETKTITVKLPAGLTEVPAAQPQTFAAKVVVNGTNTTGAVAQVVAPVDTNNVSTNTITIQMTTENIVTAEAGAPSRNNLNGKAISVQRIPPVHYLTLSAKADPKRTITALNFSAPKPAAAQVVAANIGTER